MITKERATSVALEQLREMEQHGSVPVQLLPEETIEETFGWIFFYQSRAYLRTGDDRELLAGNAPIIVDKFDGSAHFTGTALPLENYISEYRAKKGYQ